MNLDLYIDRYLKELRREGAISSPKVEEAFRRIKRHRFLSGWYRLLPPKAKPGLGSGWNTTRRLRPPSPLQPSTPTSPWSFGWKARSLRAPPFNLPWWPGCWNF